MPLLQTNNTNETKSKLEYIDCENGKWCCVIIFRGLNLLEALSYSYKFIKYRLDSNSILIKLT